ncbi:MAG: hypothetical protein QGG42_10745 [Phycisphaerae bacterium]|jgi:hypothetical protein|nr:hypothetical protein [Phycisphaerae bacterium]
MKRSCVLLLCSVIGLSCCAAPETRDVTAAEKLAIYRGTDVETAKKLATYREMLHHHIDVTIELAARQAELQEIVSKKDAEGATDLEAWEKYLRDLISALTRMEYDLRASISKLKMKLTSHPPH